MPKKIIRLRTKDGSIPAVQLSLAEAFLAIKHPETKKTLTEHCEKKKKIFIMINPLTKLALSTGMLSGEYVFFLHRCEELDSDGEAVLLTIAKSLEREASAILFTP